jgi:hypothetical protein
MLHRLERLKDDPSKPVLLLNADMDIPRASAKASKAAQI